MRTKRPEFVQVPLWLANAANAAARSPAVLPVLVEMLRLRRRHGDTFPLTNARLERLGVNRETKRRVLHDLESAGLIRVEQPSRKTPTVTLALT